MTADYLKILKQYWGFDEFRGIQREIIESIGNGHDTLGLMPTGGGKSITFQIPALTLPGVCIVITPLIALMKDQVNTLRDKGIKATCIHASLSRDEVMAVLDNCIYGDYKLLYISPERLKSELFITKLRYMQVSFVTVDEAHCISQWGYDFRPSYLQVANIRQLKPDVPILALTATATPRVVEDICNQLHFKEKHIFKMSFERKNLAYLVRNAEDKASELLQILQNTKGSTIIYTRSREKTEKLAEWLNICGIKALAYHAGLYNTEKDIRQQMWQNDRVRVMVATNAFGMGIDKADVRYVLHIDTPDSIEAYFQEAGRAGRDGQPAQAILLYNNSDTTKLKKRITENFPPEDYIRRIYDSICNFFEIAIGDGCGITREFNELRFCTLFKYFPIQLESALNILTRCGYLEFSKAEESQSRIIFTLAKDELYMIDHLPPTAEKIIKCILRKYTGVFSQYTFIEEHDIEQATGIDKLTVYETLKDLNHQGILHYIPRKNVPRISFPIQRLDNDEIKLYSQVYEQRKKEYTERINAIIEYATTQKCRSRILLYYFGEKSENCKQCDYCQQKTFNKEIKIDEEHAAEYIVKILADNNQHPITDILTLPFQREILANALQWLISEGEISRNGNNISLN